jgi:hypothetical protein
MTVFDSYFSDAFDVLGHEFGETVIYYPRCGPPRTIANAIVDRDPPTQWTAAGEAITPDLTIRVQNDATTGISHDEIDHGDEVSVAVVAKGQRERRTFMNVQNSDGQVTQIAVR